MNIFKYLWNLIKGDAKLEDKSDTAVLCVGMQRSSKYGACPGSGIDSTRMRDLLSKYGSVSLLQDGKATVASVKAGLEAICKKKLAIFFYSGHGGRVRNPKAQDGTGYSEHLALNNGPLYDHQIWSVVSNAAGRVVLIFDCCHSATMFRSNEGQGDVWQPSNGFRFDLLNNLVHEQAGRNILVWSGCPADNYSYGDDSGGVLTNAILGAYRKSRTYDEVWDGAKWFARDQMPVRTVIGDGFKGRVFR